MDREISASSYVEKGFKIMRPYLAAFVAQEMYRIFREKWWQEGVLLSLTEVYSKNLPREAIWDKLVDSLDLAACLQLINRNWNDIFKYKMTPQQRTWVKELQGTRSEWAHQTGENEINDDEAARALDTMARLMENIDQESAEELRKLTRQVRYKTDGVSTEIPTLKVEPVPVISTSAYNHPWRQIAEPHPDVAQGRFRQAEFAADLSQVLKGIAVPEYQDPVEFFARTYITDGMRGMLSKAAQRVAGKGGEPVIQLKTAFGGGKTHSMLALYHMMRAASPDSLKGIPEILESMDITSMPRVNVAVLVGTALDPTKSKRPINFPGITINTLWGEMAAQLAEQSGNLKLYDLVKDADKKGISPGSDTFKELFDNAAPCMILIDELVAYARKLYGYKQGDIPAGTFENVLSFVQELTEAARKSKNSIVVASIPESETEAGGEAGNIALERIGRTFGRMEAVWKPVVAEEGFEIVRRRLFRDIADETAANEVCNAYFEMYRNNPDDFPVECREVSYLNKMKKCYPIHPEVFDKLYNDWATMESFQRTRGVLRFMATVIHDIYISNDSGAMIMPGSIGLGKAQIREELTRYLSLGWDAIIEKEVDGKHSIPVSYDKGGHYSKYLACNRVARAIFMGSAPHVREQARRGLNSKQIHLGVVQPKENISTYNDALAKLAGELTYLYSSADNTYWYDTRPTLRKTVTERSSLQNNEDIIFELEKTLKDICRNKDTFDAVHTAPNGSGDILDQQLIRLVILSPKQTFKNDDEKNMAYEAVKEYLEFRGSAPRMYRNMVTFLAPDESSINQLKKDMRILMAWESIEKDAESLNLDNAQKRETEEAIKRLKYTIKDRIQDAYSWLLVPIQEELNKIIWSSIRVAGTTNPVKKAAQKLKEDEYLIEVLSPKILSMEMNEFKLWKDRDTISVHELWEDYTRYLYLHRLKNYDVLLKALEAGIYGKYFGYAYGKNNLDEYENLCFGENKALHITQDGILVRPDISSKEIEKEIRKETIFTSIEYDTDSKSQDESNVSSTPNTLNQNPLSYSMNNIKKKTTSTNFYGSVSIDANKLGSTAGTINQEVLQHLSKLPGAEISVTLDINVKIPCNISDDIIRTIRENCKVLKFNSYDFDEE